MTRMTTNMTTKTPKNQTKLIFFDIDDTLSREGTMPAHHIELLKTLAQTEVKLAIATGRGRPMLPDDVMMLFAEGVLDAIICINGQYNFVQGDTSPNATDNLISHYPLTLVQAKTMADVCTQNKVEYKFDSHNIMAWGQAGKYAKITANNPNFIVDATIYDKQAVYQCSVIFNDEDEKKDLNTNFDALGLKLIQWNSKGADIMPTKASKARGVLDVCAHFGIDVADTMAFGDSLNDIEMFGIVGTAVAMGDAKPPLKKVAHHITGTIEQQGIKSALQHFGVIA